jgi:hypothetical protein
MRTTTILPLIFVSTLTSMRCMDAPRTDAAVQQQGARDARVSAASRLTERYAASRLATWEIHGAAAGSDCRVLVIETPRVLEDSIVEALHYGTGAYAVYDGGVERFSRDRAFRGVAYRDRTRRVWTFGALTEREAEGLQPCR